MIPKESKKPLPEGNDDTRVRSVSKTHQRKLNSNSQRKKYVIKTGFKNRITMRKLILLLLITIVGGYTANAQVGLYSQYMFNGLVVNPAYAGTVNDAMSLTAFYRNQWATIEGAPQDLSISAHSSVGKNKRVGLGMFLENDKVGLTNWYNIFGSYAYRFSLQNGGTLSAGLQGGISLLQANLLEGTTSDGGVFDPALEFESAMRPNFGAGLYYYKTNMYVGFSVPYLLKQKTLKDKDGVELATESARNRQYVLTGGFVFPINDNLKLKPSTLVRYIPSDYNPIISDLSASIFIKESFSVGATYRVGTQIKAFIVMLSYRAPSGLRVGYAYDNSLDALSRYTSSHEVMIGYDISRTKGSKTVLTPRYF